MRILRPFLSSLLSLSILLSLGGVSIYKHYCGDFLADLSFFMPSDGCGGDEEAACEMQKKNCCEDETDHISADLEVIFQDHETFQFAPDLFVIYQDESRELPLYSIGRSAERLSPPIHAPPLYILHTQLRYYG